MNANKIRERLIKEGKQLLPEALYPNEIHITYYEEYVNNTDNKTDENDLNIVTTKPGNMSLVYQT